MKKVSVTNPYNQTLISEVGVTTSAEIDELYRCARESGTIHPLTGAKRNEFLRCLETQLLTHAPAYAEHIATTSGRPIAEVYIIEIMPVFLTVQGLLEQTSTEKEQTVAMSSMFSHEGRTATLRQEARGTLAIITPKNLAFSISMISAVHALASGNSVLLKPSEECPGPGMLTYNILRETLAAIGAPTVLIQIVIGGETEGRYLITAKPDGVLFVGSTTIGTEVASGCAAQLIPHSLELSSLNHAVVLPDADLTHAARGLTWGAFFSNGQSCANSKIAHVPKSHLTKFLTAVTNQMDKLRFGDPISYETDIGPLCSKKSVDEATYCLHDIKQNPGISVVHTKHSSSEDTAVFSEPLLAILEDKTSNVLQRELLAPVLVVVPYDDVGEATELVRSSPFGMHASIWTKNISAVDEIVKHLPCGSVYINDLAYTFAVPQLPWGGHKQSGYGNLHSSYTTSIYTHAKAIASTPYNESLSQWWFPYSQENVDRMRWFMEHNNSST